MNEELNCRKRYKGKRVVFSR